MQKKNINNRDYYRLLLSILVSYCGDTLFDLFIIWKVALDSNNIMNAAYMLGSSLAFRGILSLTIGIIVDRFNKKKLMIFSTMMSALIIFLFGICYPFAIENIVVCIIFILLNDICNTLFSSAFIVVGAEKFEQGLFIKFQSTSAMARRFISILGSIVAGWLITWVTGSSIFIINALSFLLAAFIINTVDYQNKKQEAFRTVKLNPNVIHSVLKDVKATYYSIIKSNLIRSMVIVLFLLNLAYGFIPNILPVMLSEKMGNSLMLGYTKSMLAAGEILGLIVVNRFGCYVSRLFKLAMGMCALCMLSIIFVNNYWLGFIFLIYGLFDSTTQPLFSYIITNIDPKNRGKILGGIDTIILLSPSIGIALGTKLVIHNYVLGFIYLFLIFIIGLVIVLCNKNLNNIRIRYEKQNQ